MVVYAEFVIPADEFVVGRAFDHLSDVQVEIERIVPIGDDVVPFIWVRGADPERVIQMMQAYGAVKEIAVLDEHSEMGALFRVVWTRAFRDELVTIAEADMTLLSGVGTTNEWRFLLRAPNKEPLSEFLHHLRDEGVSLTIERLTEVSTRENTRYDLTEPQCEAIQLAYEQGYFNDPREITLKALAEEVGITRQSFEGRLRRGLQNLVAHTLMGIPDE